MRMHITGIHGQAKVSTAQYAQEMVVNIAHELGFHEMGIYCYDDGRESAESLSSRFDGIIAGLSRGDVVVFQSPSWHSTSYDQRLMERIRQYGGRLIIFIHDCVPMMFEKNRFLLPVVIDIYNNAEVLIVPSRAMKKWLSENGVRSDMKYVIQEIWDYVAPEDIVRTPEFRREIQFAGNPDKFRFVNDWSGEIPLRLYAYNKSAGKNVINMGFLSRTELLLEIGKGGFGLVWTENPIVREYMKYNCNFKLSTCLAAGIPVAVPRGIASQQLLEKNHLGFAVDSLEEAVQIIQEMSEETYRDYVSHIRDFSVLLRNGYFTKKLLIDSVHQLFRSENITEPEDSL